MEVKNNTTLRQDLTEVYNKLRAGEIGIDEAKTVANLAGKVVKSATAQLEYNKFTGQKRNIGFFEETGDDSNS